MDAPAPAQFEPPFSGGAPSFGGRTGTAGGFNLGGAPPTQLPSCASRSVGVVFDEQVVHNNGPVPSVLYSWTTRDELEALRRDPVLFRPAEQADAKRGYAFTFLAELAADSTQPASQATAKILLGELFAKSRYAWPNPWATRRGWPGEAQGDQLIRIDLKRSAWVARVARGMVQVVDLAGVKVNDADVAGSPERIGAIFFVKDRKAGGQPCSDGLPPQGVAGPGGVGYREFILGNEAMVEEWSIQTPAIRERLLADAGLLTQFLARTRACPLSVQASLFNLAASCAWDLPQAGNLTDEAAYLNALSLPSRYYGSVAEIAQTIDMMNAELFEPDPLVVRPGE